MSNMLQHSFLNFSVDGVYVETVDIMCAIYQILDGKEAHTGAVYNNHNVKNDRYQIIGGYFIAKNESLVVIADILHQSGVSQDLSKIQGLCI